jgi:Flp pilus assembly protein TadG
VPFLRCRLRRDGARDRGSSAIELAILAPALLLISMLVVQWALWFQARGVALAAAQAGARIAREQQNGWPAQSVSESQSFYQKVGTTLLNGANATVNPNGGQPNRVFVTVSGKIPTLIPLIPPLTVTETAGGPVECFRPDQGAGTNCAAGAP